MDFAAFLIAVALAVFAWWFGTGVILWLDRRPTRTFRLSLLGASLAAAAGAVMVWRSLSDATPGGAALGFVGAIAIWGWHELSFLTGWITGPRREACPADARGWTRFRLASATLIHHELALAATGLVLVAASIGRPDTVAAGTFAVLFFSRLSSKLNLFHGVPRFSAELLPAHLRYLTSYFGAGRPGVLFGASLAAAAAGTLVLVRAALSASASRFDVTAFGLLAALAALGLLEHLFMLLPIPDAALWRWWAAPTAARDLVGSASPFRHLPDNRQNGAGVYPE